MSFKLRRATVGQNRVLKKRNLLINNQVTFYKVNLEGLFVPAIAGPHELVASLLGSNPLPALRSSSHKE